MAKDVNSELKLIATRLKEAKAVFVLTGAGMSKESGIPTFREPDGFWAEHSLDDLATPQGFNRNPKLVWEWYEMRRYTCQKAQPNAGHFALSELESFLQKLKIEFLLATQNIDGLHSRAGISSQNLIELHGSINHCRPVKYASYPMPRSEIKTIPSEGFDKYPPYNESNEMLRPHIVWFTETLDPCHLERCYRFSETCDVCFSIGTMGAVFPAAEFPIVAKRNGAYTIEINPNITDISCYMDSIINLSAAIALPLLLAQIKSN